MTEAEEEQIGDTLWRAIDFHRSGRRGLSHKKAFILSGLRDGHLSNNYPWILNEDFIATSRASVRFEVLANDPNTVWESSSSEEEADPERRVKAKGIPVKVEPKGSVARQQILRTQEPKAYSFSSVPKQPLFPPPVKATSEPVALESFTNKASSSSGVAGPKLSLPGGSKPPPLPKGPPPARSQALPLPKGLVPKKTQITNAIFTVHLKLRKKPSAERSFQVHNFLEIQCQNWSQKLRVHRKGTVVVGPDRIGIIESMRHQCMLQ